MNFRQHVDQKFRLCPVVWRIAVDLEEAGQAVDQVIDGGCEVGAAIAAAPLIEKQAVAFIFLEWRGIEDAKEVVIDPHRFYVIGALASSAPVERIDVL